MIGNKTISKDLIVPVCALAKRGWVGKNRGAAV